MSVNEALPILPFRQITDSEAIDYMMRLNDSHQKQAELYYERQYLRMMEEQAEIAMFVHEYRKAHMLDCAIDDLAGNPIGFE